MKKKWLLALLAVATCIAGTLGLAACGEDEAKHEHKWSDWSVTEAPTSTATGKATRTCSGEGDCDATTADKEHTLPSLTSTDYTLTDDTATCEAAGTATYAYSKSGVTVSFTAATDATGHAYGTAYTYEDETGHWQICANNSAHTTAKQAHDENGTDGACSKCGYTAPAHKHDWSEWTITDENKPTEETTGKATRTCNNADCDAEVSDKECVLPALTSNDYSLTNNTATCEEAGTATYTYNENGVTVSFTAATDATGHDWNEWTLSEDNKPTADEAGKLTRTCKNAGCTADESDKEYELPALMSEYYSLTNNTAVCEDDGTATYTYDKDGVTFSFTAATPAPGHSKTIIAGKAATCYEDGLTDGEVCSICRTESKKQTVIPTNGHKFDSTYAPVLDETNKTVSQRCGSCNTTVVYNYDNAVLNADGAQAAKASLLSAGINYVTQSTASPWLGYTFTEAGTYTIYWVSLNNSTFKFNSATLSTTSNYFINASGTVQPGKLPEGFALEGYCTSSYTYYITDENGDCILKEDGNKATATADPGEYIKLEKNNLISMSLANFIPLKFTLTVTANQTLKFKDVTTSTDGCFLIGIDKQPAVSEEYCKVSEGEFAIKNNELEFTAAAEEGTYTFTAPVGEFELYVNGALHSDGSKTRFGYINFSYRYLTLNLQAGDVVKVKKVSGRAYENIITIYDGEVTEPDAPEYNSLHIGTQTITLTDTNTAVGKYELDEEKFYSFTPAEGGYFNISVAEDVTVNAVIRADKTHYSTIFQAPKTSGVFYVAAGETVIIAFTGNGAQEFNVNVASCEKPIIYLNPNEKLENVAFDNFETIVELTVGDSVAEGEYLLTFEVPANYLRSYIYISVNEAIAVEDIFDSNAVINKYINPDVANGANNTVGPNTGATKDGDFVRTVTLKKGDTIYLATSALTAGNVSITLTPVAE